MPTNEELGRRDVYVNLVAWGELREETKVGMIALEDCGSWQEGQTPERQDKELREWLANEKTTHFAGIHFVPSGPKMFGPTERMQCQFSLAMRDKCGIPYRGGDLHSYYVTEFLHGFEVVGNLYPFAKPRKDAKLDRDTMAYLGFETLEDVDTFYQQIIDRRLHGICILKDVLARNGGVLLFMGMGTDTVAERITQRLFGHVAANRLYQAPGYTFAGKDYDAWHMLRCLDTSPVCCFVQHPSGGGVGPGWFTPEVLHDLVECIESVSDYDIRRKRLCLAESKKQAARNRVV